MLCMSFVVLFIRICVASVDAFSCSVLFLHMFSTVLCEFMAFFISIILITDSLSIAFWLQCSKQ